ncbi:hypothetical protein [Curtobacterium sp. ER1/6]|uniref:hypothetical protein n=1 Tax=Curtobacterium sp. ER1/6 TaxID=1891920 RepID=UPI00084FB27A|nr:hypothetical protein [Curtobacterium sp. ER1/6]OEI67283.1 hypothetical protein Cus16_3111 [Curtobacterium sp. ER1/6]
MRSSPWPSPASDEVEFRASAVLDVRRADEPVEALGARAIREALARPGWTHVVADQPWLYADDNEGRVLEALYEDCGICVNLTRFLLSTGSVIVDLQMRASVRDRFRVESLFEMIAGSLSVQEDR